MLAKVASSYLCGLEAYPVVVEVDLSPGLPLFTVVGLPDAAVRESKDRVKAALKNCGFTFPLKRVTVNLAPADIKKEGSSFDLPIAIGILVAEGVLSQEQVTQYLIVGELSLDGSIKGIKGALSVAVAARGLPIKGVIFPSENSREAALVSGVNAFSVETLPQVVEFLSGTLSLSPVRVDPGALFSAHSVYAEDFSEIRGQENAKRALEVAAAGGHNILMIGPPGSGKTMLAKRLPTILPRMTHEEVLETTRIYSVAGLLSPGQPLVATRPFRSPHHTISDAGLVGGGQIPKPGEVSLAHNGVLFLDELLEFRRNVLEVLRQPVEDGCVTISRASVSLSYPARFMLVAAMNPCPCGYFTDPSQECLCTPLQIQRYRSKISGPLLDRIDIQVEVPAVPFQDIVGERSREESASLRERVSLARTRQARRYQNEGIHCNAHLRVRQIKKYCESDEESKKLLETAMERFSLSARAYHRILRVSRTIADLAGREKVFSTDVAEAIQYRSLDRKVLS